MDAAHGIADCSVVTAMARNGVTTALRVSGLGREWFQSPSDMPIGLCFPGHADADGNPDLGDSAMCETAGFGGFSLAASPALVQWVGGSVAESIGQSREMYEITTGNPALSPPNRDVAGAFMGWVEATHIEVLFIPAAPASPWPHSPRPTSTPPPSEVCRVPSS